MENGHGHESDDVYGELGFSEGNCSAQ